MIPIPHVVITGDLDPARCATVYRPIMERTGQGVLKTDRAYLSLDHDTLLIEALAIEEGSKRSFLVAVQGRPDGVVVRLHPLIDPEKTDGVKRILALIARRFKDELKDTTYGETNLGPYLDT